MESRSLFIVFNHRVSVYQNCYSCCVPFFSDDYAWRGPAQPRGVGSSHWQCQAPLLVGHAEPIALWPLVTRDVQRLFVSQSKCQSSSYLCEVIYMVNTEVWTAARGKYKRGVPSHGVYLAGSGGPPRGLGGRPLAKFQRSLGNFQGRVELRVPKGAPRGYREGKGKGGGPQEVEPWRECCQ